ncbi:aspartate aminotransferase family protein [Bradyrhizobium yuanmingense]|uniref:4-aminobutyrate---pyruvate transaminase n=4 Tax=Nitrobacteraceae TaxID=41294 RepID=A0A1C3XIC1_9BRAD|nr:aspartate aminotransferase family protein [Bradyrhizobium yuanmingense]MCA1530644.1 aspartate aminotransferase family protein [Bradyrhizobium yuanmingense]TWI16344.1 4-aminobutyrate--pyruvate transaminase [Bradyrhizobium yuanmingense]SCB52032.1 4-aminobutyrate---pyruvate transaminase [Bradyrhizobium yuanmingense]
MLPNSQQARDAAYQLHAYTNARSHQQTGPHIIDRGEGPYVFDTAGKRYLDAMAGLWSAGLGFSEKRLIEAAHRQMQVLPFYHTFASRSNGPSIELAEKLVKMSPVPMSKVFFTNSGSEANDTVLKLITYRSNALGQPQRKKVISRLRSYHGVTIATASLTGFSDIHRSFDLPLPNILHTGSPHFYKEGRAGESEEAFATRRAEELESLIRHEGPDTIAAFFGEPVMGAGGVIVPPPSYWDKIQKVLKKHSILLVADEVICGFGRTGKMFGCETYDIAPDVIVVSKQLTSSYFPLSAIIMNDYMFEPIADESNKVGVLAHGFTGGGHPVGAAVALETLKLIDERGLIANVGRIGAYMQERLRTLSDHPLVGEVRGVGLIAAIELVLDKEQKVAATTPGDVGRIAARLLHERGIILRNVDDTLAMCPPLIVDKDQIDELVDGIAGMLDELRATVVNLGRA